MKRSPCVRCSILPRARASSIAAPFRSSAWKRKKTNKRPSFTNAEINALLTIAEQRIAEMSDHPKLRYERIVLFCFVAIAVDTGMRPTELYNLNWANIVGFAAERTKPLAHRRIRIQAYGKGFQPRELVPNVGVFGAFENLWELYLQHHGEAPADGDPIFRNIDGDRLGSIKNSLNQLLDATKLKQDAFGRARTAYSLRHTYASNQIRKGTGRLHAGHQHAYVGSNDRDLLFGRPTGRPSQAVGGQL